MLTSKLEYTLYAFTTDKGTFTLIGSHSNGTDTFKCIETGEWHEWNRTQVKEWFDKGKIKPVEQAKEIDWYLYTKRK